LDAIGTNVTALRRWVGPRTRIAAVVKAQAYGGGATPVARAALAAGASWLAVARVHEGIELRTAGIRAPILVMNRTDLSEAYDAARHDLTITVDTTDLARALGSAAHQLGRPSRAHLKVDTGLHRFGVNPDAALPLAREVSEISGIEVQGLWTHFASADEPDSQYTLEQLERFERVTDDLAGAGYRFPMPTPRTVRARLACVRPTWTWCAWALPCTGKVHRIVCPAACSCSRQPRSKHASHA